MEEQTLLRTANKGEWSELYVLFKVFDEREIAAAGPDLRPIEGQSYKFLKILREDQIGSPRIYDLEKAGVVRIQDAMGNMIKSVDARELGYKIKRIFTAIKEAKDPSFELQDIDKLMQDYDLAKIKSASGQKMDLLAVVPDDIGARNSELGFSIKSHVGGAPTLINPSSHTNFTFEVKGYEGNIDEINIINDKRDKVRKRIAALKAAGATFQLSSVTSSTFNKNLRLSDTAFPMICAQMLLEYYSGLPNNWESFAERAAKNSSLDVTYEELCNIVKTFLRSAALGMVPSKEWDTRLSAYGGYIVVLNDGTLVCYHLLNDDEFKEYLFGSTKFDTPSTTKFNFGYLYENDGRLFIDLNLQIRFTK
jgi:type II restriction enzyme